MDKNTTIKNELIRKLKTVSEDREFLLSVINSAWHIDDRKTIINYLDTAEDVTYENVLLFALTLYEEREK